MLPNICVQIAPTFYLYSMTLFYIWQSILEYIYDKCHLALQLETHIRLDIHFKLMNR